MRRRPLSAFRQGHVPAQSSRIAELDGLRAVAMTGVIAQHCGLFPSGWTGVWLFFVISGFVITRGFLQEPRSSRRRPGARYLRFMGRRAVRILPLYLWYMTLGCVVIAYALHGPARFADVPYLLTMTYNWQMIFGLSPGGGAFPAFGHLWTLSVEEQFYLVFPVLVLGLSRAPRLAAMVALVAAGPLLRTLWSAICHDLFAQDAQASAFAVYASSVCHFDAFVLGALLAHGEPWLRRSPRAPALLWTVALVCATGYLAVYCTANYYGGARGLDVLRNVYSGILYGAHREVFVYVAIDLLAAAVLVHALRRGPGSSCLRLRPVALVGRISYGGYVYHALILWTAQQVIGTGPEHLGFVQRLGLFGVVWTTTAGIAALSFYRFEQPLAARLLGRAVRRSEFVQVKAG